MSRVILVWGLVLIATAAAAAAGAREAGPLIMDGIPPLPDDLMEKIDRYLSTRDAVLMDWARDDSLLISTRFGDTPQLHLVAEPLGARRQLTFFDEPIGFARFSPHPRRNGFVFFKDRQGDENYQLYYYDMDTERYRPITDGRSRSGFAVWSNSGLRVAYYSNQRNGTDWDIYVTRPHRGRPELVIQSRGGAWLPLDWSPDDDELLILYYVSINESALYVADLVEGEIEPLEPDEPLAGITAGGFSKDGRGVFLTSDRGSEFRHLRHIDLRDQDQTLISGHIPWDVERFDLSDDGRYVAFVTNEAALSRLHVTDLANRAELALPELPPGPIEVLRFDRQGQQLAITVASAAAPRDVYVIEIASGKLERWTRSEVGGLDSEQFKAPELISFPTFDRVGGRTRQIPAFVYVPRGRGPHPVLIHIHGGPEAQFRPSFNPMFQYYLNELGFAVVAPNVRGSSGYGKTYLQLDNGRKREDAVADIAALLDWIATRKDLDERRVVVSGASYGGYMALAAMVNYGDRLLGGVDVVGISNFVTFLENTSDYRRDLRRQEYGDERDPAMREYLLNISPVTQAGKIDRPLLVVQGLNDPRVPASESEQMVTTIRARGGNVWYLAAKNEGHGFKRKENRRVYYATMAMFLKELLVANGR